MLAAEAGLLALYRVIEVSIAASHLTDDRHEVVVLEIMRYMKKAHIVCLRQEG